MAVQRSASMAWRTAGALKAAEGSTTAAPVQAAATVPMTQPKQWKSGTGRQMLSASVRRMYSAMNAPLLTMLRCVRTTPLCCPVVPEVYWMFAGSVAAGSVTMSSGGRRKASHSGVSKWMTCGREEDGYDAEDV